jgi:hypothetical protein
MRRELFIAAAVIAMTATGARAEGWCGYAAQEKAMIECGYSSINECESAIGKGAMCFIDPDYALNSRRATPATAMPAPAAKPKADRG